MESLPLIKLAIDIALAGAVFYLAWRVGRGRGPSLAQIHTLNALEQSLIKLLREADEASGELQKALTKEQKKLEELLFDIETVEHRVNKSLDEVQTAQRDIKRAVEQVNLHHSPRRTEAAPEVVATRPVQNGAVQNGPVQNEAIYDSRPVYSEPVYGEPVYAEPAREVVAEELPEPASFNSAASHSTRAQSTGPHTAASSSPIVREAQQPYVERGPQVNIYGEPIHHRAMSPSASDTVHFADGQQNAQRPAAASSLRDSIEREHVATAPSPTSAQHSSVQQSLEDIYAQCEELLQTGNSIQQVATFMNLTVDEVETLQRLMAMEDEPVENPLLTSSDDTSAYRSQSSRSDLQRDPRLGVLGGGEVKRNPIGRSTQVVS
ncbi:MAG: hypothetical protein KDD70_01010 [Bdellovibrionales bacterium]|nr:hypothetical protein [Bdellovibrionales bacterium]